jgi:hypothetical protein
VSAFIDAAVALQAAGDDGDLCGPFASALPVTGVSVSTLGDPFGSETVCASDASSARLDEIQLDLGEGPCWDALLRSGPVLEHDLQRSANTRWPMALDALRATGIGAVFAFPMRVGMIDVGAVDLYTDDPGALPTAAVRDAAALTDIVARQVLQRALTRLDSAETETERRPGPYSRRELHQATGMVAAQLHLPVDDARLVLGGHAYASGRPVRDLAADVVAGVVDFSALNDSKN